jgi:hypothetical protein
MAKIIDLDEAIIRMGGKFDRMVERCYYRPVEGEKLVLPICAQIPGDQLYQCRSVQGVMAFLTFSHYAQLDEQTRLEKRYACAVHAAEPHAMNGEAISVVVNDRVLADNHSGKAKSPLIYDASTNRTLLVSLVANGDLKLWERSDSRILRGGRRMQQRPQSERFMRVRADNIWIPPFLMATNTK